VRHESACFWLVSCAIALAGCPGVLEDPERFIDADGCPDMEAEYLPRNCSTTGCHWSERPAGGLDLASPGLAARLVDVESTGCGGVLVPSDVPMSGLFRRKLEPAPACGSSMPIGQPPMNVQDRYCFEQWLLRVTGQAPDGGS